MRITIVTNIPTPYRNPVYSILSKIDDINLLVLFCDISEPNRSWKQEQLEFNHKFLSKGTNTFVHYNPNILKELNEFNPDVVITAGFNPTMLLAWTWSLLKKKKHIPFSDANLHSESTLSILHQIIRKIVYTTSTAFLGASKKTLDLYKSYKVDETKFFKSVLAIDNKKFTPEKNVEKKYDLLFCGQFNDRKQPLFFIRIATELSKQNTNLNVLLIGNGPLKKECISELDFNKINYYDAGFVQPSEIIKLYQASKLFIFPTKKDPWGLVANEALAAGLPVLVSSAAGVARELVIDGYNGFVFEDFDLNEWISKIKLLLTDENLYTQFSVNAKKSVKDYTHEAAAIGIFKAVSFALSAKLNH
jgi:glycosyltransferase involved in cell wall biosynthesis